MTNQEIIERLRMMKAAWLVTADTTPESQETAAWAAEAINGAISALKGPTREQVEKMRGEWRECFEDWREQIAGNQCSKCGFQNYGTSINHYHFCPACGSPMTGEAVEMTLKRLEEMQK